MSDDAKKNGIGKTLAMLVIGGAVGSVVGLALAPEKGEKTREKIKEQAGKAVEGSKQFLEEHATEIETVKKVGLGILRKLFEK